MSEAAAAATLASKESWFKDTLSLLPLQHILETVWDSFQEVPLDPFQQYAAWAQQCCLETPHGLDLEALRKVDPARCLKQPRASVVGPMISTALSARQHLQAAVELASPFAQNASLEKDLQFAVREAVRHGLGIQKIRDVSSNAFRKLARSLLPLDTCLLKQRHVNHVPGC